MGGLVSFLEARDLLRRAILVVTSDHGTEFGEHGGIGHARGVYEEQVHVPLIFRHPDLAWGGRRVRVPAGLIDLAPTFLDLAGAAGLQGVSGVSLVPLLGGDGLGGADGGRSLFGEQLWGPRKTVLRTGRHAWIQMADGVELYDLRDDPHEQRDLAAQEVELAEEGARQIERFRAACGERRRSLGSGTVRRPLEPERVEALRALGYVE